MDNHEIIDRIKENIDIVGYIGKYVKLKQAGRNFVGLCPFHQEKTPSFNVNPTLGIYKCFGCGKGGDVISFTQEVEKIDFPQAIEKLAKEAGIPIEKSKVIYTNSEKINELSCRYYQKELFNLTGKNALEYLKKRGITDDSITKFRIGYASGNGDLYNYLKENHKFSDKDLLSSGIFVIKEGRIREKFFKRVLFPIFSTSGKVIAFTGRVLPGNDKGPKYLHNPETDIFHKKDVVYGLNFAKNDIRKNDLCIIVEGTTDVISASQEGICNIVAPLGTSLTPEQLKLISKYTKNILFLFDTDLAGQNALERGFRISAELGLSTFATNTGEYHDVDEMVRGNKEAFKKLVSDAGDAFTYLVSSKANSTNISDLREYTKLIAYIKELLSYIKDPDLFTYYKEKSEKILGKSIDVKEVVKQNYISIPKENINIEQIFLKAILETSERENIDIKYIRDEKIREIVEYSINNSQDASKIYEHFKDKKHIQDIIEKVLILIPEEIDLRTAYSRLEKSYLEQRMKELRVKLAASEEKRDTQTEEKILEEINKVTTILRKYK